MKIDRTLKLVKSVTREDGAVIHVHATPISLAVFEENALLLAKTFSVIYGQGLNWSSGPRVAAIELKRTAAGMGLEDAAARLLAEIHRMTMVVVPTAAGWDPMPFDEAVRKEHLDAEDVSEVDNAIVFFSLAWRMHSKAEREAVVNGATRLWSASTTFLNSTEFAASLPTSTEPASSGASPTAASLVPS